MTREEALKYLYDFRDNVYWDGMPEEALDMAIKALEHPERNIVAVVPCGDAISRTEVLKLIYDYKEKHSENSNEHPINYGTLLDMIRWIRDLPSVTSQELIHDKCNQCKYYEGVHNVQGHAPCSYHKIGGVLWNWYCSQFESEE